MGLPAQDVTTSRTVIEMTDVHRVYQMGDQVVRALDGLTVTVESGEFVAIMGASGSGKSTLLNLLGCLDRPTRGDYRLRGQQVGRLDDDSLARIRNREIGFVFQTFNLLSRLTATRNVELPLVYARTPPVERRDRALRMLDLVGLGDRADHRPSQLSGGQRQRVAIARALVQDPAMLLADEPTGNLDSESSGEIMTLFDTLHRRGHTIVVVTHDADIAARAERVVRMMDGRIVGDDRNAR